MVPILLHLHETSKDQNLQFVAVAHRPFNDILLVVFGAFFWDDPLDFIILGGTRTLWVKLIWVRIEGGMGTDDLDFSPFLAVLFADEFEGSDRK